MDYAEISNVTKTTYNKGFMVSRDKLIKYTSNYSNNHLKIQGVQLLDGGIEVSDKIVAVDYLIIANIGHVVNIYECKEFNSQHPNDKNLFTIEIDTDKYGDVFTDKYGDVFIDKKYKLMVVGEYE